MPKFWTSSKQLTVLFVFIALASLIGLSQAAPSERFRIQEPSDNDEHEQRRRYDLDKLRLFLLTSNAEQRAAKREQQEFQKRALIREYLQSSNDPNRLEELKKRIKTFCNSYEDVMNSDRATCG